MLHNFILAGILMVERPPLGPSMGSSISVSSNEYCDKLEFDCGLKLATREPIRTGKVGRND